MATTQREIARELGISSKSVARALNGHAKVSVENRRRVLEAAGRLGYGEHTNREARALVARRLGRRIRHNILAVALPNEPAMRHMPFFADLLDGVEAEAQERGLDTFYFRFREDRLPRLVEDHGVDGLVCLVSTQPMVESMAATNLHSVSVAADMERFPCLLPDDYRGLCLATQHLIDLGHRAIAYIGHAPEFPSSRDRLQGYRDTLRKNDIPVDPQLIDAAVRNQQPAETHAAVDSLLERNCAAGLPGFTAIATYNDNIGNFALDRLQHHGIDVPMQVSVAGFDDVAWHNAARPALTSVAFDRVAMGRRAVAMLAITEDEEWAGQPRRTIFPVALKVRATTARPPY